MSDVTATDLAAKVAGSSFYAGMRVLPKAEREAMYAIYGFCRIVDDIADDLARPIEVRRAELDQWRGYIGALYRGEAPAPAAFLSDPIRDFAIERDDFIAVIDGMQTDLDYEVRWPPFEEFYLYCDRVASAVGRLSVKVFGMERETGIALSHHLGRALQFTNVLRDTSLTLADVVYTTNVPQLEVVPAGVRHDNAPELLASARMAMVVEELCARASPGVVIVDSPPVLATNEAQVMTRYAGQVLMVVRADSTEQRVLAEALSLVDRSRPVSAVLNRVEPSLVSRYYSHYYYGYGRSTAK